MASVKDFLGDGVIYGIGTAIKKFIGIFLLPFYARALSPEEYGIIDILSNSLFFLSVFCTIGLNGASGRFFYMAKTDQEKGEVLFTSIAIRIVLSVIVTILLIPFSSQISQSLFNTTDHKWTVFITCLMVPISILSEEQSSIYRYYRKAIQFNIMMILQSMLNIAFGIYLVILLKKGVLGANAASAISAFLIVIVSFLAFSSKKYKYQFNFELAKKMLQYGFPLIGVGILGWVYSVSDRYFLLYYKNLDEIGLFSIGNTFSQPLQLVNTAVLMSQGVLIMSSYENEEDDNKPKTKALANRILQIYLIISIPIILSLSIFGTLFINFLTTPEYRNGALVIPYLGFSNIFTVLYVLTGYGMDLKLKTNYYFWLMLIAAFVNVALNFYFIPEFGFLGAGITTLFCNVLYFTMAYYYSQKFFYIERRIIPIISYLSISFIISLAIPVLEIQYSFNVGVIYKILLLCAGLMLPFLLGIVTPEDITLFRNLLRKKKISTNEM